MDGAESLVRTLVRGGIDVCFANPGTSEMHFVAALDRRWCMDPDLSGRRPLKRQTIPWLPCGERIAGVRRQACG